MINGMWKGKKYIATDIAKDYNLEKLIRKASSNKELSCPDPDCNSSIKYCRGPKKKAYFAHIENNGCDYVHFDSNDTEEIMLVRLALFEHFRNLGYDVQLEVKINKNRYAHLLFNMEDKTKIALQICTNRSYVNYIDSLTSDFASVGIKICWIVLNDKNGIFHELDTYCSERGMFYETKNKELVAINSDCTTVFQCKKDTHVYKYKDTPISFTPDYAEIFNYKGSISQLTFINNELTMVGFDKAYEEWLCQKKNLFDAKFKELSEKEQMSLLKKTQKYTPKNKKKTFEEYTDDDFKKQKKYVSRISNINSKQRLRDRHDNVWLVCKECQDIKPLFEFEKINDEAPIECEKYNYPGKPQMGYCKKCFNK